MSMISMGLLVSARLASEEISGGIMTLMSWPMVLLSGVFFSLDGAPAWVRSASELLPLTHLLGAARAIMIDGAGLADVSGSLVAMAGMTALFVLIGAAGFRWTQD
jgi:ABC-type multidrug transport system permease subunit